MINRSVDWSDLVTRMKANDRNARSQFIDDTQKDLFQFCFYLTRDRQSAEDILHDTYLKAFKSLESLKNPNSVVSWMKQMARFLYLDYLKSAAVRNEIQSAATLDHASEDSEDKSNQQLDVTNILAQLEETDRTLLVLIDIQESSYEEAALILQIPVGTVKSRLFRAREKFSFLYDGTKRGT